jgi:NADPH-dependent curcumin reductase CurA
MATTVPYFLVSRSRRSNGPTRVEALVDGREAGPAGIWRVWQVGNGRAGRVARCGVSYAAPHANRRMPNVTSTASTSAVFLRRQTAPSGPVHDDFGVGELPLAPLQPGQVLVRNAFMSVDPSMRGRLEPTEKHYTTNFVPGQPLDGSAIGIVVESADPAVPEGAAVRHRLGWRELAVVDTAAATVHDPSIAPLNQWLGALGQTGFTAYAGLLRTAEFVPGDAVFVSAAAGAVGSMVGQFARLLGASRVVGSAGGEAKRAILVDELGFDDAFDYRAGPAAEQLRRVAPDGIDVYFDNVGGEQLVAALDALHLNGRIAICGMISNFAADNPRHDIGLLITAVLKRLTIRGFIVRDHEDLRPEFEARVAAWLRSGEVVSKDTIYDGLEHAVDALFGVMSGANIGKMLVRLDPDA